MLFNDATAIKTEGKAKRKAIRDATLAEQKEKDDLSCAGKEWKRRTKALGEAEIAKCSWRQNVGKAVWKHSDKQVKEEMRNEADQDWQHIERERKRRDRERIEAHEDDEDWQRIERDRPSGNKPSGSGCGYHLEMHEYKGRAEYLVKHRSICDMCPPRNPTLHGHIPMPIITSPKAKKEEEDAIMTNTEVNGNFYCGQCQLCLNGAEDYAKHMVGKFHNNRMPNLQISNIAMDMMHVTDNGIGSMLSSSSSSKK